MYKSRKRVIDCVKAVKEVLKAPHKASHSMLPVVMRRVFTTLV